MKNSMHRQRILCWTTLLIEVCVINYFLRSKMQSKFKFMQGFRFNIQKFQNLKLFCIFDWQKYFLHKLKLAKLFSIKFSVYWCYFLHDFSAKNSKKFDYYNENMYTKLYFQMHLSRWGKRFRWCHKNKKCSIFHALSKYIIFSYDCNWVIYSFKSCRNGIFKHFGLISDWNFFKILYKIYPSPAQILEKISL